MGEIKKNTLISALNRENYNFVAIGLFASARNTYLF